MKIEKRIKKIVSMCVGECCYKGKINHLKVTKAVRLLKSLPREQSILAISEFLKGIKQQKDKYMLIIESSTDLTKKEINKIVKQTKNKFPITEVKNIINPFLIGGIKLKIGDVIYDNSLKDKIKQVGEA